MGRRFSLVAIGALTALLAPGVASRASATTIPYAVTVQVTSAPLAPGSYGSNPWSFGSLPSTFSGTFDADDTVTGPISNLVLIVGGLNLATNFPMEAVNFFDPATLTLMLGLFDASGDESFVGLNSTFAGGQPPNYATGIENNVFGTLDPYSGYTQNWVGTFSVTAVPEPATLALLGTGLLSVIALRRRRQTNA